jgi:hypothetical protein
MIQSRSLALPAHVVERVEQFLGSADRLGTIERLPLQRLVADYCEKFIALDVRGRPSAFIAVSPASHPDSVRKAADTSGEIRAALGPDLGFAVLTPHFVGDIDGQSYSITAYCTPLSSQRWLNRWQRLRMGSSMLAWLTEVTRHSAKVISDVDDKVRAPLEALASNDSVDEATRQSAASAIEDLDSGRWRPRAVIAHNDLWWGNFVHRSRTVSDRLPFRVIDWAGGKVDGMPFYDLVRLSISLNPCRRRFRHQLQAHAAILGCEPADSLHYLSVAFGELSRNLGEWPVEQFSATARACLGYARRGVDY